MIPHFSFLLPVCLLLVGFSILLWSSLLRQRRQDMELRQSEARYHSFFENSPLSLWEEDFSEVKAYVERLRKSGVQDFKRYFLNHPGEVTACAGMVKILDVNKATMKMYNVDGKKDFFAGLSAVLGEEVHEAFVDEMVAIASNKSTFEAEDFNRTLTGERKDILLQWSVVPGHELDYSKVLVSIIDITERKQADQALRESEKRYRDLVENISEVYFLCDQNGSITYSSPNFFSETGYLPEEILGRTFLNLIVPQDRPRVLRFYRERTADGTVDTTCEFRGKRKDGSSAWVEQSTRIIRGPAGNVVEYRNVVRDISERVHVRDELASREKRFRALIEESSDVIALVDSEGAFSYVSSSITRVLGYAPDELIGRSALMLIHPGDLEATERLLGEVLREPSKIMSAEIRYKEKNGSWRWIEGVGKNMLDDPAIGAIVVNFRDITDRKIADEMLRELPIRIINAQESERRRVARELHDSVNQILSSVKFRIEGVEERTPRKNKALLNVVASAKSSLEKAMQEVRRISQNLRPSELDDLGVIPAVRSMCEEFEEVTKVDVDLKFLRFPKKLSPEIEVTMYRIIQEALSNVAKHSEATHLAVRCEKKRSRLQLTIKDDGKGADERDLVVHPSKKSGMGLLNMKERAAYVGGTVLVHSSQRGGIEIEVQLPL
ncbi:MAG TPA: PAS domain S-box protein [Bacteroidota bacterium]|nr:PAS domain S-box protein [Bacteroidota bacterium]